MMRRRAAGLLARVAGVALALALVSGVALAHGGSLRGDARDALAVPTWLFLLTGGGVVGATFLLASFLTDRAFVASVHGWRRALPAPRTAFAWTGRAGGLVALFVVAYAGFFGPVDQLRNAAVLLIWVGWWAGLAMVAYLVGDPWPALNPARTLARTLPGDGSLTYPDRLGAWPSVAALLALVWVEIVSPLADDPGLLAAAVVGYVALSVAGATLFGLDTWFDRVDPIARVFRTYGMVAPVQRTDGGLRLVLPGSALTDADLEDGEVAFVVALLWGTTFDGLVALPGWSAVATPVVEAGVPPRAFYLLTLLAGFALFFGGYRLAAGATRSTAPTYVRADALARRFAPALVPIAAGYHLAHYLGYLLSLSPALVAVLLDPASPPAPRRLVLPAWFGGFGIAAVLVGHLLAVWVAHAVAFETFPGRLQAVRSQYPLTAVMVFYTMTSLWIVTRPSGTPPYL